MLSTISVVRSLRHMGAALLTVILGGSAALAGVGVSGAPVATSSQAAEETGEWTTAELAAARPLPLPERAGDAVREGNRPRASGTRPVLIPGTWTADIEDTGADVEPPPPSAAPLGYSYPPPFTRYRAFNNTYSKLPHRAVGKLFFRQYGESYVCTASVIGEDAIWTAGHCIHAGDGNPRGWSTDLIFIPAYREGIFPYGQWRAESVRALDPWVAEGDFRYDMGGAILRRKHGRSVRQTVGSIGFAANLEVNQHWTDLGYPAAGIFDGLRQQVCSASYAYSDETFPGEPFPLGIGCDQTGGASGGPWLTSFRRGNYLNGHNSYRYSGKDLELFSPYYGDAAVELFGDLTGTQPQAP